MIVFIDGDGAKIGEEVHVDVERRKRTEFVRKPVDLRIRRLNSPVAPSIAFFGRDPGEVRQFLG